MDDNDKMETFLVDYHLESLKTEILDNNIPHIEQPGLIGLCGFGGVGKDTVAAILHDLYDFKQRAFADKLREMALELNFYFPSLNEDYKSLIDRLGYDKAKRSHPEVRNYLVKLGEVARNVLSKTIWIDVVIPLKGWLDTDNIVVSDVRNLNEAERIRSYGGSIWRIHRTGVTAAHPTEEKSIAEILYDKEIFNNGSLIDLRETIIMLMTTY